MGACEEFGGVIAAGTGRTTLGTGDARADISRDSESPTRDVIVVGRGEGDVNFIPGERLLRLAVDFMAAREANTT